MIKKQEYSLPSFVENRSLFSDYYLAERLSSHPEWSAAVSGVFQQTLELYRTNREALSKMNEYQTEKEFIRPFLSDVLGFHYDVQQGVKRAGSLHIPDYTFFGKEASLKEAQVHRDDKGRYLSEALALGDAKYWGRSLDGKGIAEKDKNSNANPSFQIVNYLTANGLDWGILTNGKRWRLYSLKSRSRVDSYFEVNLQRILEEEDEEQFKYFYYFFRSEAFQSDPQTGQNFLETVYEGSIDYGARLEDRLKGLIFDEVFLKLARGFVAYRKEELGITRETEDSLNAIYQGTLRLLYRLLFLLHAESRGLLPVDDQRGYYQHSLMKLKREIARKMDSGEKLSTISDNIWNDLAGLFRIIDRGDAALNVPRYNGGLFRNDHPKNEFLTNHSMVDQYIIPVIERLTRETVPGADRKRFIDYKSLNVEQLGSVYEGLLEFHLRIADQPLAIVKERGREVFKPKNDVKNPSATIGKGELYLENDKGERKATGSYYTPHYIVEYIVKHTLGPVFEEREAVFEDLMEDWIPKYDEYSELTRKVENGDQSERTHNRRKTLALEIESLGNKASETLLSLKICDPAMGSGHFLKEATDKLAEKIITLLAKHPKNPVTNLLNDVRHEILQSLSDQGISIDAEEHLKDTNLIKRMVMKRCIYGVDLNPMAVELAKLSLWLDSFTVGAPLSFLNHHLKAGNSLIGTSVGEVKDELTGDTLTQHGLAGQLFRGGPFAGMLQATGFMHEVAMQTDATIAEIEESVHNFSEYETAIDPYKQILDLWISRHFGNGRAQDLVRTFGNQTLKFIKGEQKPADDSRKEIFEQARTISYEKQFFHWELEFPEVFIDLKQAKWLENPGFDVVVGNPPYDILIKSERGENLINYTNELFKTSEYNPNYYALFSEIALNISKIDGWNSFIVPNMWLTNEKYSNMRKFLFGASCVVRLIDLKFSVFSEIIPTMIYVLEKEAEIPESSETEIAVIDNNSKKEIPPIRESISQKILFKYIELGFNEYLTGQAPIIDKNRYLNLKDKYEVYRGIETRDNSYYLTTQKRDEKDKPVINATDVTDYFVNWSDLYVRFIPKELKSNADEEYYKVPSKVLLRRTGDKLIAGIDRNQFLVTKNLYLLIPKVDYSSELLCGILNSKLMNWERLRIIGDKGQVFAQIKGSEIANFPLPKLKIRKSETDTVELKNEILERLNNPVGIKELIKNQGQESLLITLEICVKHREYLTSQKSGIQYSLDPFKFFNKGVAFKKFSEVFSEAVKYGRQLTDSIDIGTVHHDIEGLQLCPQNSLDNSKSSDESKWLFSLHLKHRDPDTGWADWIKEDGKIVRSTQPVYRFELNPKEGRYWQQCFEVLDEFENSSNFPGGKTRTTHEKLMKTKVPVFDENANIKPLIELKEELAEAEEKIEKTDWLIDQLVYQLYGLSEEEIAVVEKSL